MTFIVSHTTPTDGATKALSISATRRIVGAAVLALLVIAAAAACTPPPGQSIPVSSQQIAALDALNSYRASQGIAPLAPVGELNDKAQAHAHALAAAGSLFHTRLAEGISAGWKYLGENVAYAGDVPAAQQALVQSPPHNANMLNARFNEVGTGVVVQEGVVYVVQVFVQR